MNSKLILVLTLSLMACIPQNANTTTSTTTPTGGTVTQTNSSVKSSAVNVAVPYYAHYNFPNSSVENTFNAFKSVLKTSTRFGLLAEGPKVTDGFELAWKDKSLIGVIVIDLKPEQKQKDTYVLIGLDSLPIQDDTVAAFKKDLQELGVNVQKTLKLETSEFKMGN
jgi:hypothetical protein